METFTKRFSFVLMMVSLFAVSLSAQNLDPQNSVQQQAVATLQSQGETLVNDVNALQQVDELPISTFSDSDDWVITSLVSSDTLLWEFLDRDSIDGRFTVPDQDLVTSPTKADGYAILNYSRGVDGNTSAAPIVNELTSPSYDVSSLDAGGKYQLSFYNQVRHCCTGLTHSVSVSLDGGATFINIGAPSAVAVNDRITETTKLNLPDGVENATEFQIRFTYTGGFYFWVVDDIMITPLAEIDVVTDPFISIAPNIATPVNEAPGYSLPFLADIRNIGSATVDIDLALTIFNAADEAIFTDTTRYAAVETDSVRENQTFDNTFPMPTEEGTYRGVYEVFTDRIAEDSDLSNNTQEFTFFVTSSTFSKGPFEGGSRPAGGVGLPYGFSNIFYTSSITEANSDTLVIDSVSFAMFVREFTGDDEAFLDVKTFGFRGDLNGNFIPEYGDASDPAAELVELSSREFLLDAAFTEIPDGAAVTYAADLDGPVVVPSDQDFVGFAVSVEYLPGSGGTNGDNSTFTGTTDRGYAGFRLAAMDAGIVDSLSTILATDGSDPTYTFFTDTAPFIDAQVSYMPFVSSVKETELAASAFSVRPNPATTQFSIDFDFGTTVNAHFEIINAVGQTISTFNRDGLSAGAITIPTQGMNNGLYYVKVRTNDGQTASRKLMLKR